jgi:adenylate cyclase
MFDNVIVGVDEHEGGRDAIELAKRLATPYAEVRLAYIVTAGSKRGSADQSLHDRGREVLADAREDTGIEARLSCIWSSSVGRGLHELAEYKGADLLVVGSTRHGLLGRVAMADDTRAALNGARCAIAVAPSGYRAKSAPLHEIGVGYDGSPESEHALGVARALATQHEAKLSAFEAISIPTATSFIPGKHQAEAIDALLEDARARIAKHGDVEPRAEYGDPAEELALYGATLDLLVIGSRGYGPLGRIAHGSVAQQLARTARCPLLVLTRGAPEPDTAALVEDVDTTVLPPRRDRDETSGDGEPSVPTGVEIERKFLVEQVPDELSRYPSDEIEQGYLAVTDEGTEVRLRRYGTQMFITIKGGGDEARVEEEIELDPRRFDSLWPLTEGRRLGKRRYRIPAGGDLTIELDVYEGRLAGLVTAEVEFDSTRAAAAFEPPPWLRHEITDDPRYKNKRLATADGPPG